jgi:hypothetical protein
MCRELTMGLGTQSQATLFMPVHELSLVMAEQMLS